MLAFKRILTKQYSLKHSQPQKIMSWFCVTKGCPEIGLTGHFPLHCWPLATGSFRVIQCQDSSLLLKIDEITHGSGLVSSQIKVQDTHFLCFITSANKIRLSG